MRETERDREIETETERQRDRETERKGSKFSGTFSEKYIYFTFQPAKPLNFLTSSELMN